ncbi:MAG: hypothetical protein ACYCVY_12555 [Acidiferrobacteraceae bacterium]
MKIRKCRSCKVPIPYKGRGRYPKFCSAACRQHTYWKRVLNYDFPVRLLKLWHQDLEAKRAQTVRDRLVNALERMGYEVTLTRVGNPQTPKPPALHVVKTDGGPVR